MAAQQQPGGKVKVTFKQAMEMLFPYVKSRIAGQIKSVALIIVYLILFQTIVLRMAIAEASIIAVGLALVIAGLAFFMEGLMLGLMPLGEIIGLKLPQKSKLPVILIFAFILGMGATFAEPAIGVLKAAGSSVKPWEAPLVFLLLNKFSSYLVYAVGAGVGVAVMCGMLRFMYQWSLKPFIYVLVGCLVIFTMWAFLDPNMRALTGLAWDCGAVTTGPVTVPLVLALGIGICRIVGSARSGSAGFGVVTLASLFPIITVLTLGTVFRGEVPKPMEEAEFFSTQNRDKAVTLFTSQEEMYGYAFMNASEESQLALFDGSKEKMLEYIKKLKEKETERSVVFPGQDADALQRWAALSGTKEQRLAIFDTPEAVREAVTMYSMNGQILKLPDLLRRNGLAAAQAIIPLTLFLVLTLVVILREKLPRSDEIMLGILFALIGMMIFSMGIELGLGKLGNQVGGKLPSSFKQIELTDQQKTIVGFDPAVVQTATTAEGEKRQFFYLKSGSEYETLPYKEDAYDVSTRKYTYLPTKGPLFGTEGGLFGIIVVLLFAFFMGYGATMAEPALNALGLAVEEITVGTFKKALLMQAVALGVGVGITLGVVKIIWSIPLAYLLAPPYILLLFVSKLSTEEFVNIGWDSAGVTTGPVTVPLVLAMGLGIGTQVGVVEGFGILAMASVCPILSVLSVGLSVTRKRKAALQEASRAFQKGGAA
ncbi:MAG: DUF1538 domain-containing protein [Desulfobacterales bacterium]|nr:DUF1538 domain-containing protein [Desulfobacterales bacterium]